MKGFDIYHNSFIPALKCIREVIGNSSTLKIWDYGPSPYIWSCKVWKSFYEDYLFSKSIEDFFQEIKNKGGNPAEALIYGEYLLKKKVIPIISCDPLFKVYHYKKQFEQEYKFHDVKKLKKIYLGIIFQSNWARKKNVDLYNNSKRKTSFFNQVKVIRHLIKSSCLQKILDRMRLQ